MSEEEYKHFKNQEYLEKKMETSIDDLQIEDPSTIYGKGPYSHLDQLTDKNNIKNKANKSDKDRNKDKNKKRKCKKGYVTFLLHFVSTIYSVNLTDGYTVFRKHGQSLRSLYKRIIVLCRLLSWCPNDRLSVVVCFMVSAR